MKSKIILALTGAKGSGKDYFADVVKKKYNAESFSFADPIKKQCMDLYQLESLKEYDKFKRTDTIIQGRKVSGRHLVRELGMLMRSYDISQFVFYVDNMIEKSTSDIILITDLRFQNELDYFESVSNNEVRIIRVNSKELYDGHESETKIPLEFIDHVLYNNKDKQFKKDIIELIESLKI